MAEVTIGGSTYQVYSDVAFADEYLAADVARAAPWDAAETEDKSRGLVTGARLLMRSVPWLAGVPDLANPPEAVKEANALLAADILAKPALGDNASTGSNVKSVTAKGTGVEFFRGDDSATTPVPSAVWALLLAAGLIGSANGGGNAGPYYSGACQPSRFTYDRDDYGNRWDVC